MRKGEALGEFLRRSELLERFIPPLVVVLLFFYLVWLLPITWLGAVLLYFFLLCLLLVWLLPKERLIPPLVVVLLCLPLPLTWRPNEIWDFVWSLPRELLAGFPFLLFPLLTLLITLLIGLLALLRLLESEGLILPFFVLFVFAVLIDIIIYVIWYASLPANVSEPGEVEYGLIATISTLIVVFGLPALLPWMWTKVEWVWWKIWLGRSTAAHIIRAYALKDFRLLIRQREIDGALQRQLAAPLALNARLVEFRRLHRDLKRMKDEKEQQIFEEDIGNLNEGWISSRMPPRILDQYIKRIQRSWRNIKDTRQRMRGRCTVANVKYLRGYLKEARKLAKENWG